MSGTPAKLRRHKPLFVLDESFPEPVLKDALNNWVPEVEIRPLKDVEPRLLGEKEDWKVILGVKQAGGEALLTCDDGMLYLPEVVAVIEQTTMTVVVCQRIGHDGVVASGLLLAYLPRIAGRHNPAKPQVWQLAAPEKAATPLKSLKESILKRSGRNVDDYKLSSEALQAPLFP